ncbi:MAG: heme-binding protein [Haloarculaceae archaeon]
MVRREPPETAEGWYALHDLRTIDWAAWQDAPERVRQRATEEATAFLQSAAAVEDADAGDSALFAVTGHKADLMVLHLRPTHADVEHLERRFEGTEFARFTEQASSYVSVTEASGYSERAREYFESETEDDSGLAQYIRSRLHPEVPDHEHVSFYPMSKRRDPDQNWYDLPFEERAEHMASHGDIGRGYAGKVQQMITGSVGMDDWEWGVTLWADDVTDIKELLYEMRFDPSTSKFAEFGPFYLGRQFPPADLEAYLAGERVSTDGESPVDDGATTAQDDASADHDAVASASDDRAQDDGTVGGDDSDGSGGRPPVSAEDAIEAVGDVYRHLAQFGVMGSDYDDGDYGLVCYAEGDAEALVDEVSGLRDNFDHYDTHVLTDVRADQGQAAVVSVWANERAASTAAGFLTDVDAVTRCVGGPLGDDAPAAAESEVTSAATADDTEDAAAVREALANNEVYAGKPHGEDVYALVVYSAADPAVLAEEVAELRRNFDRYDTHVRTAVYETDEGRRAGTNGEGESVTAVVTLWETEDAADTASEYLTGLPDVVGRPEDRAGFGTMGMFYTVESDHREDFVETFGEVGDILEGMDGHRETALLVNREDADDMFIASRWESRDDAMQFFRSEDFRETVEWGREVLADRPRHVFLA